MASHAKILACGHERGNRRRCTLRALTRIALLPIALLPIGSAHAASEEEEVICVVPLTRWSGDLNDVRNIHAVPVPESYRRMFGAGPCNTLDVGSLITWHMAFGDERSTAAALAFLEQSPRLRVSNARAFAGVLEPAWERYMPSFRKADAVRRKATNDKLGYRVFNNDPAVKRLSSLATTHGQLVFLAQQYMRAAEFFSSNVLLDKANQYLRPASDGMRTLYSGATIALAEDSGLGSLGLQSQTVNDVRDLEARSAVLQARQSKRPSDREAAKALLESRDVGLMKQAAEEAFEHGDSFCDTAGEEYLAEIAKACGIENDFESRVLRYWRARAQVDLLADDFRKRTSNSFELAMKLLQHELRAPAEPIQSAIYEEAADAMAALLIQRFEAENRVMGKAGEKRAKRGPMRLDF